jgi:predicted nucleic acid-binding protein
MVKPLFDTNILIDHLNAKAEARAELGRFSEKAISIITWMEVMVGAADKVAAPTRSFLARFDTLGVDFAIAERAVEIRKTRRIKLPDAIIWATAQQHGLLLVTRNTKDFPATDPGVRHPYGV